MESKKLPVVYLLRTNYGDKHLIRSASEQAGWKTPGNPLAVWKLDSYPGATCEPYIPAARVRDALRRIDELLVIQSSCRETTKPGFIREFDTMMSCTKDTRKELAALIADVEDHEG